MSKRRARALRRLLALHIQRAPVGSRPQPVLVPYNPQTHGPLKNNEKAPPGAMVVKAVVVAGDEFRRFKRRYLRAQQTSKTFRPAKVRPLMRRFWVVPRGPGLPETIEYMGSHVLKRS